MERLDADIGSFQTALQKTAEIIDSVRVHVTLNVSFRVTNHLIHVVAVQAVISHPRIAEIYEPPTIYSRTAP
jgi:hypothetical protein